MTRVAAIDCGTNSIRLLISDVSATKHVEIAREMEIVRLGEGVDATGELNPKALKRTEEALQRFVQQMEFENVQAVRMVATSATRDASNQKEFFDMTARLLGRIQPGAVAEVISGEEEAQLSFRGATLDIEDDREPYCVIDLGGGSTEFIVGTSDGEIMGAHSNQMGCVRLTERMMLSDPPTLSEQDIARDFVAERLEDTSMIVPLAKARTFVGCAGTFTTLSALAQGLERYDPREIHMSELKFQALRLITQQLIATSSAARAAQPVIHPGRADVIGSGAVIVEEIMTVVQKLTGIDSFVISEKDILDGIVAGLASEL
ncbi:Ppx/GppA phosphatase family protein [Corynebacterium breve]|uniref:Ppx/GppA phosphatase family protein n=1 Tax=Corynebacterium breve TaxID=3049799 RepID=A0ABY8VE85_9CORY|nr:Ppx/GppA phosphatase family protein [Corynebacterium breve]WIM67060.1 Ppx/GppA phosphatase family protein [Corynebacterium breve]